MEDVASAEEIAALHKMHETDHAGCKKKVREFMGRLSADRRASDVIRYNPLRSKYSRMMVSGRSREEPSVL